MSVSFLKHYYNFSITFNVILRSISGTGKIDNIIIFNILRDEIFSISDFGHQIRAQNICTHIFEGRLNGKRSRGRP